MKYIKPIALAVTLSAASVQANAGLWDSITSFFGGSDEATETAAETATKTEKSSSKLVDTGLQLLPLLTQQLGVSNDQAQGGMGALLQAVKLLLPNSEFSQISNAIPGVSSLLAAAPKVASKSTESSDSAGSLISMAAEQSETLKAGTQLISQFESLGLGADMIPKFTNVTETYLKENDKADTASLLKSALSSFM